MRDEHALPVRRRTLPDGRTCLGTSRQSVERLVAFRNFPASDARVLERTLDRLVLPDPDRNARNLALAQSAYLSAARLDTKLGVTRSSRRACLPLARHAPDPARA